MTEAMTTGADTAWFTHSRFGMFIHWGLYSLAARHEWVQSRERISPATYRKYFEHFDPDLFDPTLWADAASRAGMQYFVVTTKHHEGFCLWDSALTDYKATNTPARRDLLHPIVDAFRGRGLRVGFYHSLLDWHHPDYSIDIHHPLRDLPTVADLNRERTMHAYRDYLHGQTRELLTQFGKIDIMWFDFSFPQRVYNGIPGKGKDDWGSEALMRMVRELQPGVIVNDRLEIGGDVKTPEEYQPAAPLQVNGQPVLWEACQTFNGSWGYYRDNHDWRSSDELIRTLIDSVSKGGNLLLNVGPTGRGEFDAKALDRLNDISVWMRRHGRSIYGCGASTFTPPPDARYTQNGKRLYLHLMTWPYRHVHLPGLAGQVEYAQLLNDASEVKMLVVEPGQQAQNTTMGGLPAGTLTLELPMQKPDVAVPVVELFLK